MRLHPFGRGTLLAMAVAAVWLGALPLLVAVATHDGLVALIVSFGVGLVGYGLTSWRLSGVLELDALVRATRRRPRGPEAGPHGRHGGSGTSGDDGTSGGDGKGGRHVVPLPAVGPR
jgi:hypothetical protein